MTFLMISIKVQNGLCYVVWSKNILSTDIWSAVLTNQLLMRLKPLFSHVRLKFIASYELNDPIMTFLMISIKLQKCTMPCHLIKKHLTNIHLVDSLTYRLLMRLKLLFYHLCLKFNPLSKFNDPIMTFWMILKVQ